jgi:serine/threonine protein kinase
LPELFEFFRSVVTPANMMIAADGTPKMTDFGPAKRLEADSNETRSGAILGTPCFMSPEQASGELHRVAFDKGSTSHATASIRSAVVENPENPIESRAAA